MTGREDSWKEGECFKLGRGKGCLVCGDESVVDALRVVVVLLVREAVSCGMAAVEAVL